MAKLLKKLLSGNAGQLVESVGGVLDNLITSDEERKEAKTKLKQLILDHETKAQEQVTARWEADMKSDNWLSKNIRPVVLIFLTAVFVSMSESKTIRIRCQRFFKPYEENGITAIEESQS